MNNNSFFIHNNKSKNSTDLIRELQEYAEKVVDFQLTEATERSPRSPVSRSLRTIIQESLRESKKLDLLRKQLTEKCSSEPALVIAACVEQIQKTLNPDSPSRAFSKLSREDQKLVRATSEYLLTEKALEKRLDAILERSLSSPPSKDTPDFGSHKELQEWSKCFSYFSQNESNIAKKTPPNHTLYPLFKDWVK
jgi:hypothetical protein